MVQIAVCAARWRSAAASWIHNQIQAGGTCRRPCTDPVESKDIKREIFGVDLLVRAVGADRLQRRVELVAQLLVALAQGDADLVVDVDGITDEFIALVARQLQPVISRIDVGEQRVDAPGLEIEVGGLWSEECRVGE